MEKYEFVSGLIKELPNGLILKRIRALIDFDDVAAGDLGGWIESEENLSHEGNCWAYEDSWLAGTTRLKEDGKAYGYSVVLNSTISGHGKVMNNARVNYSDIMEYGVVKDDADLKFSIVSGNAIAGGESVLRLSIITDDVIVTGGAKVWRTMLRGNLRAYRGDW